MFQQRNGSATLEALGSTLASSDAPAWSALLPTHPNILFEGTNTSTEAFLSTLRPYLREPILWRRPGAPLELEAGQEGSLILQEVAGLDLEQQRQLSQWLQGRSRQRQIVSTTSTPLFPLVERGLFDPVLYYRLNVLLLQP
ncbi:MAG: sigma 54-interacting transcriptional regulator [Vicinamibacterales bacterium]